MKLALVALLLLGCSGNLSKSECDPVVDRMIEIFTAPGVESPSKDMGAAFKQWRDKLVDENATKQYLLDKCQNKMTSSHASCVKEASDEKALAACFGG